MIETYSKYMNPNHLTFLFLLLMLFPEAKAQRQTSGNNRKQEVLLIGTFHFHNPGTDAVKFKTLEIQSAPVQKELEVITDKIKVFGPDKMYVEWDYKNQAALDSLYALYLKGEYFAYVDQKFKGRKQYAFYSQNEIFQFAFRAAKKAGLKKVHAIDYELDWPADTAFSAMNAAHQDSLANQVQNLIQQIGKEYDYKMQHMTLTQLLLDFNTQEDRKKNAGFYIRFFNRAGSAEDFAGAFSVSEWYRRNLYIYAQIQKQTLPSDKKIMVLLGAGHTAMLEQFIKSEDQFKIVELQDLLKTSVKK